MLMSFLFENDNLIRLNVFKLFSDFKTCLTELYYDSKTHSFAGIN